MKDKYKEDRVAAVTELKHNTEKAHLELLAANEKRNKKLENTRKLQEKERADILAAGGNPEGL